MSVSRERVRELLYEEGRRVLRYAPFVLSAVLAAEAASHLGDADPWMTGVPAAGSISLIVLGWMARRPDFSTRFVSLGLLTPWAFCMVCTALHSSDRVMGSIVFLSIYLFSSASLIMPTVPAAISVLGTWCYLVYLALGAQAYMDSLWGALLFPLFSLPVVALVYASRRRAIIDAEEHRLLLHEYERESARAERLERLAAMAGGAAHHFNNLLTPVLAGSDLAIDQVGGAHPARSSLELVASGVERATAVTARLSAIAGLSPGGMRQVGSDEWVSVSDLERDATGRKLSVEIAEPLPDIRGNAGQLRELLGALVRNAKDASGPDECIRVRAEESLGGVVVEVADEGEGIPPENEPRIFEPFFTSRGPGREGLGLSLALGIVGSHGGDLQVDSAPGAGTRVRVWLPKEGCSADAETRAAR